MTAFLDGAASLCRFLAVRLRLCVQIVQSCHTEQVESSAFDRLCVRILSVLQLLHALAVHCRISPSYLRLSPSLFFFFFFYFRKVSLRCHPIPSLTYCPISFPVSHSIAVISSAGSCSFLLSDDKRKDSRCEVLCVSLPALSRFPLSVPLAFFP